MRSHGKSLSSADVRLFHRRHRNHCIRPGWVLDREMLVSNSESPRASQSVYRRLGALNDVGGILGTYAASDFHTHGFLLYQGKFTRFMFPGSTDTIAHDINTTGTIVGDYSVGNGQSSTPLWSTPAVSMKSQFPASPMCLQQPLE